MTRARYSMSVCWCAILVVRWAAWQRMMLDGTKHTEVHCTDFCTTSEAGDWESSMGGKRMRHKMACD